MRARLTSTSAAVSRDCTVSDGGPAACLLGAHGASDVNYADTSTNAINIKSFFCWFSSAVTPGKYTLFDGFAHLASGLSCGLAGLAAGMAIGIVGDAGVRWVALHTWFSIVVPQC